MSVEPVKVISITLRKVFPKIRRVTWKGKLFCFRKWPKPRKLRANWSILLGEDLDHAYDELYNTFKEGLASS